MALLLDDAFGPVAVKSWFFGTNRALGDCAPATVLRHAGRSSDLEVLMPAAQAFVYGEPT